MISHSGTAGYNRKISEFILDSFHDKEKITPVIDLQLDEQIASKYAIALQSAWRRRQARIMVTTLKQESNCKKFRLLHPIGDDNGQFTISNCDTCLHGQQDAEIREKLAHQRYTEIDRLLFEGQRRLVVIDRGDNWNQRFQSIVSLPENTELERSIKYAELYTLNHDFVSTAKTYAQTIISEFFLHHKDKSIHAKRMGGIAGGEKYLWRGILFKMATGTSGPYNGSDEAAAKAAGHDLKGSIHYYNSGVKELHLPLMAVIDYKGFRMTAQALLPLGKDSLVYGSADAGKTIHNSNPNFNLAMEKAAKALNLRKHAIGELSQLKELHSAVDVEGHIGLDNRFYLLDLARTFPPEAPSSTKHLNDVYGDGTTVLIKTPDPSNPSNFIYTRASVHRAYPHGSFYDILFEDGSIGYKIPSTKIQSKSLSIFWRLLRPEYVRTRGTRLIPLKQEDINPINSAVALTGGHKPSLVGSMSPLHIESVDGADKKNFNSTPVKSKDFDALPITSNNYDTFDPTPAVTSTTPTPPQTSNLPPAPAPVSQPVDNPDYDSFDTSANLPPPPMPPVPKLTVLRQQTLGYDDFELSSEPSSLLEVTPSSYDNFDTSNPNSLSPGYDTFDANSNVNVNEKQFSNPTTPLSKTHEVDEGNEGKEGNEHKEAKKGPYDYGFFRNSMTGDYSPLPSVNPSLLSSPSNVRMKANRDFELSQENQIINLLDRYRDYDIQEVGVELQKQQQQQQQQQQNQQQSVASIQLDPAVRHEELKIRQAYIEATVADLYQMSDSNDSSSISKSSSRGSNSSSSPTNVTNSPLSTPLSPDALTFFTRFDPEAVDRNREVTRATDRLVNEVIPALAAQLALMNSDEIGKLDLSVYFHSNGVNMRHLGLVRSHIPGSPQNVPVRTYLLLNIVCRTLKNIAREYQRRWMKSEQSSSEQGILFLLTQFLNLIVGQHVNSDKFWSERVIVGISQRFGKCALDGNDAHLQSIRKSPTFLTKMVQTFLQMMNLKLKPSVLSQFLKDNDPYKFEFMVEDIESLEPKVKYMHIVDYVSGVMLQEQAATRTAAGDDIRTIIRLRQLAGERFSHAERTMPLHNETCQRNDVIRLLNAEHEERDVQPSSKCKFF